MCSSPRTTGPMQKSALNVFHLCTWEVWGRFIEVHLDLPPLGHLRAARAPTYFCSLHFISLIFWPCPWRRDSSLLAIKNIYTGPAAARTSELQVHEARLQQRAGAAAASTSPALFLEVPHISQRAHSDPRRADGTAPHRTGRTSSAPVGQRRRRSLSLSRAPESAPQRRSAYCSPETHTEHSTPDKLSSSACAQCAVSNANVAPSAAANALPRYALRP